MRRNLLFPLAALIAIAGCGGGGGHKAASGSLSRKGILALLGRAVENSSNIRGSARGKPPSLMKGVKIGARAAFKSPFKTREGEDPDLNPMMYNEWIELWEKQQWGLADDPTVGSGTVFFEDEAGTVSAGGDLTYVSDGIAWPRWVRQEVEFKAGRFKGEKSVDYAANNEDGTGVHTATAHYPGEADYTLDGRWDESGKGIWTQRWDYADGTWGNGLSTTLEDYSSSIKITTSAGITFDMMWNLDLTGSGTISGEADGLPATLVWDAEGNGTIAWSDGSKTTFEGWGF